jgi:hypothetical protein
MKTIIIFILSIIVLKTTSAQSPVGKWKTISHISTYAGKTFDSYKAALKAKPCASKFFWEINSDGTYRHNTSASTCDENHKKIQAKLYSKTNWKVDGNKIRISTLKDFSVGQTYTFTIKGNKMVWVGTEGQGTITFEKL